MGWLAIMQLTLHSLTSVVDTQVFFPLMLYIKRASIRNKSQEYLYVLLYLSAGFLVYEGITMKKTQRSNAWCKNNAFTSLTTKC
jgi:hypothetical protein